jgi:homogentisate phytyltransferase/homogentisate geranylgeranyltransferase
MSSPVSGVRARLPARLTARAGSQARPLATLWRFSRPHTIIGTTLGIVGLYVIATSELAGGDLGASPWHLLWVLVAGWAVNVFIVGINQLEDVEIDRIAKPWLPIAAGELSRAAGWRIVAGAAVLPVVLAVTQGAIELIAVSIALAVGAAYSCPPLRLKRFPALAALSIAFVRALVLNLGVWMHFSHVLGGGDAVPAIVWALCAVTLPFGLAIAVLKDMPDVEGDRRFAIATFSVRLGARPVLRIGVAALTLAGVGMALAAPLLLDGAGAWLLAGTQLAGLTLLWRWALALDLGNHDAIVAFYQRVWRLFFLEYVVVPLAVLVG